VKRLRRTKLVHAPTGRAGLRGSRQVFVFGIRVVLQISVFPGSFSGRDAWFLRRRRGRAGVFVLRTHAAPGERIRLLRRVGGAGFPQVAELQGNLAAGMRGLKKVASAGRNQSTPGRRGAAPHKRLKITGAKPLRQACDPPPSRHADGSPDFCVNFLFILPQLSRPRYRYAK
jgi:hypothetical protein